MAVSQLPHTVSAGDLSPDGRQELEPREGPSPPSGQPGQSTGRRQPVNRVLALTLPPGSQVEHFAQTQGPQTPARKGPFLQGEFLGGLQLPSPAPMVEIKGSSTEVEKPLGFS